MAQSPAPVNVPRVYYSYEEAVAEMGFSYDFATYTICEAIYAYFVLFNAGPIICINVFDSATNMGTPVVDEVHDIVNGRATIPKEGVLASTVFVKDEPAGTITYVLDTDYVLSYDDKGQMVVSIMSAALGGSIPPAATKLKISSNTADPTALDDNDIIGGSTTRQGKEPALK